MLKRRVGRFSLVFFASMAFFASCVTINIYFPAAAVEKAADQIIRETWGDPGQEREGGGDKAPGGSSGRWLRQAVALASLPEARAQQADIDITTPAIRAIKGSMAARAEKLKPYLDSGVVGIGGSGLLEIRDPSSLAMKDKAALTRLVDTENGEREALYGEIARANNFGPERVADIRTIFAASWVRNARPGWWYRNQQGQWVRKEP